MLVNGEFVAVVFIQAVQGAEPHEPRLVLNDGGEIALRQAVVQGEVLEFQVAGLGEEGRSVEQSDKKD